jgi:anti-anti-sigma factor
VLLLRLTGRLEARGAVRLRELCAVRPEPRLIVLNLEGVTFLSSSGVGVLLALSEMQREHGGAVHLSCATNGVRATLQLMNLESHVSIFASEEEALREAA